MSGPALAELLRWMADMPAAFRADPEGFTGGNVRVRAVVADLFETYYLQSLPASTLEAFDAGDTSAGERNRLRWVLAAAHLLWHPAFRQHPPARNAVERLLTQDLPTVAGIVRIEQLDTDEQRREELIRRVLRALGRTLPDETTNEAEDRFRQVDSIERRRVLLAAEERERRTRQVREAMAKQAAQAAAAKVSRE